MSLYPVAFVNVFKLLVRGSSQDVVRGGHPRTARAVAPLQFSSGSGVKSPGVVLLMYWVPKQPEQLPVVVRRCLGANQCGTIFLRFHNVGHPNRERDLIQLTLAAEYNSTTGRGKDFLFETIKPSFPLDFFFFFWILAD